jgi:hypothetical protein
LPIRSEHIYFEQVSLLDDLIITDIRALGVEIQMLRAAPKSAEKAKLQSPASAQIIDSGYHNC